MNLDLFWLFFTIYMSIFMIIVAVYVALVWRRINRLLKNTDLAGNNLNAALERRKSNIKSVKTVKAATAREQDVLGSRLLFNRAVSQYNSLIQSPVSGTIAKILGHEPKKLIDIE